MRALRKVLYQVKNHMLDPLSDDIAWLDLDVLLAGEGWGRGGQTCSCWVTDLSDRAFVRSKVRCAPLAAPSCHRWIKCRASI